MKDKEGKMATSEFSVKKGFDLQDGDPLLFFYLDERQPLFPTDLVPEFIPGPEAPGKEGKSVTLAAGRHKGRRFLSISARLDDKHTSSPANALKRAVASAISRAEEESLKRIVVFV